ncbi:hypothetical protein TorRG33x02_234600, partial [Trema orientale]
VGEIIQNSLGVTKTIKGKVLIQEQCTLRDFKIQVTPHKEKKPSMEEILMQYIAKNEALFKTKPPQ